jgi:hypothetical protein
MKKILLLGLLLLAMPLVLATETLTWESTSNGAWTGIHPTNPESGSVTGACGLIIDYNSSYRNITTIGLWSDNAGNTAELRVFLSYLNASGHPFSTPNNTTYMDYYDYPGWSDPGGGVWVNVTIPGGLIPNNNVSKFAIGYSSPNSSANPECDYQDAIGATGQLSFRRINWNLVDDKYLSLQIYTSPYLEDTPPPTGAVVGAGEQATEYAIVLMAMLLMIGLVISVVPLKSMNPTMKKVVVGTALAILIVIILVTIL